MRRTAVALFIAGSLLGLSSSQSALAIDNLFPGSLFPDDKTSTDDKSAPLQSLFSDSDETPTISKAPKKDPEAAKKAYQETIKRDDEQMRAQMQKVASWLQEFSLRNQNRFPGVYGDSNTIKRASEVQLTELVGGNPYANSTGGINNRELNGLTPGLAYYYNSDGTPVAGSPLANDEWTAELTSEQGAKRIDLEMDQNATDGEVDSFRNDAPTSMEGTPGTIMGRGNGQGFLYVYGIGADGKLLKDYNGKPYFIVTQTANTVEDQGQEAGY